MANNTNNVKTRCLKLNISAKRKFLPRQNSKIVSQLTARWMRALWTIRRVFSITMTSLLQMWTTSSHTTTSTSGNGVISSVISPRCISSEHSCKLLKSTKTAASRDNYAMPSGPMSRNKRQLRFKRSTRKCRLSQCCGFGLRFAHCASIS